MSPPRYIFRCVAAEAQITLWRVCRPLLTRRFCCVAAAKCDYLTGPGRQSLPLTYLPLCLCYSVTTAPVTTERYVQSIPGLSPHDHQIGWPSVGTLLWAVDDIWLVLMRFDGPTRGADIRSPFTIRLHAALL